MGGLSLVSVCSLNTFNLSEHGCGPCGVTQRQSSMCTPDDLNASPANGLWSTSIGAAIKRKLDQQGCLWELCHLSVAASLSRCTGHRVHVYLGPEELTPRDMSLDTNDNSASCQLVLKIYSTLHGCTRELGWFPAKGYQKA